VKHTLPFAVWAQLTTLRALDLTALHLTGSVPTELGLLTELTDLQLGHNALHGPIPTELGRSKLRRLGLEFNALQGTLPSELGRLSELTVVALQANELTGSVPAEYSSWRNVEVGSPTCLNAVPLHRPTLPQPLTAYTQRAQVLMLSDNKLQGRVDFLSEMEVLSRVYL
jgi:Leucine-rich repeat (LRR) protein